MQELQQAYPELYARISAIAAALAPDVAQINLFFNPPAITSIPNLRAASVYLSFPNNLCKVQVSFSIQGPDDLFSGAITDL